MPQKSQHRRCQLPRSSERHRRCHVPLRPCERIRRCAFSTASAKHEIRPTSGRSTWPTEDGNSRTERRSLSTTPPFAERTVRQPLRRALRSVTWSCALAPTERRTELAAHMKKDLRFTDVVHERPLVNVPATSAWRTSQRKEVNQDSGKLSTTSGQCRIISPSRSGACNVCCHLNTSELVRSRRTASWQKHCTMRGKGLARGCARRSGNQGTTMRPRSHQQAGAPESRPRLPCEPRRPGVEPTGARSPSAMAGGRRPNCGNEELFCT